MNHKLQVLKTSTVITVLIYIFTTGYFLLSYFCGKLNPFIFFNADAFYLPALYKDLFINHNPLSNWHMPSVAHLFPDFFLFCIAKLIFSDIALVTLAYAILQGLCFIVILYFILVNCYTYDVGNKVNVITSKKYAFRFAVLANALFMLLAVLENGVEISDIWTLYRTYQISSWHFGSYIMNLLGLLLILLFFKQTNKDAFHNYPYWRKINSAINVRQDKMKSSFILIVCLGFVVALSVFSDKIYIVQFVVPMFCACGLMRNQLVKYVLLSVILGLIIGYIGSKALPLLAMPPLHLANLANFITVQDQLFNAFDQYFSANVVYLKLALLSVIISGILLAYNYKRGMIRFLVVYFLFEVIFIWIATIINGGATTRYLLPIFFGMPLLMFILANPYKRNVLFNLACYSSLLVMGYNTINLVVDFDANKLLPTSYYLGEVACLDEIAKDYNVHYGIAQYWDVKKVNVLSKNGVELATVNDKLEYTNWVDTSSYRHAGYDFAFIDLAKSGDYLPNVDLIKQINGDPMVEVMCGQRWQVLVYGNGKLKLPNTQYTQTSSK